MSELIERQEAIDKINERQRKLIYCFGFENDAVKIMDIAKSIISAIPHAQPEPKEGHWINGKCDRCGEHAPFWAMASTYHESNYCPNCGAKMTTAK